MTRPVFIEELGAVLLPLGDLQAVRRFTGRQVGLVELPEQPILDAFPELVAALSCAAVVSAAGGEALVGEMPACAIGDGACIGEPVRVVLDGGRVIHLCWHHDNQYRDGQQIDVERHAAAVLAKAVIARVASWCGVLVSQLQPLHLCWWASVYKVLDRMPTPVLRAACRLKPRAQEQRWVGAGSRPTGEHHSQFVRPLMDDPLAGLRTHINSAPAISSVNAEPQAMHMARPKQRRWTCEAYLAFVRQLPCVVTGRREGIEAHHLIGHGQGKMGGKVHDLFVFPLAHDEHRALHHMGWQAWEQQHGSQIDHVMSTLGLALGLGVFNG